MKRAASSTRASGAEQPAEEADDNNVFLVVDGGAPAALEEHDVQHEFAICI